MKNFTKLIQAQLLLMCATGKLFIVEMTGQEVYDLYLASFKEGDNPIFRDPASSEHNCNHCNNFLRRYGNIVAVGTDGKLMTLFDVDIKGEYEASAKAMSEAIGKSKIKEVFFETFNELNSLPYEKCSKSNSVFRLGVDSNPKRYTKEEAEKFRRSNGDLIVQPEEIKMFNHFFLDLPKEFVDMSGSSVEALRGAYRDAKNVFQRAMEEISVDTLYLVKDLINQGSLLDGTTHLHKVETFIPYKLAYDALSAAERDNWCWVTSYRLPFAKFKNELIGVLCSELSEGKELNAACEAWNKRVDPANYMKAVAPITKKQIEEAKKFVEENGYEESFDRRFAVLDDIKASEIKHINAGPGTIKKVSVLDSVKSTSTRHKRAEFDGIEEVTIDKFMKDILPRCTSIEAFLKNTHEGNMVSLTTANNPDSKPIFKWSNNYSWTFSGNLAGKSQIKEAVATKGGRVDGVLRFSMIWNDDANSPDDRSDLDAWCIQPNSEQIGYSTPFRKDKGGNTLSSCSGQLDLDNTDPYGKLAVENIYFADLKKMKDGAYTFIVNQFREHNSKGFKAEIEFDGETYYYEYNRPVSGRIIVAAVTLRNGSFSIEHKLPESGVSSKEIYGLETNEFHKVNLVCLSPNHWGENTTGNKHYFFMLENCKSPTSIRSFHNENLNADLLAHRKVMEVLGATKTIETSDKQLSGLGFNATVRDEVIVKVQGSFKRMLKIKF